MKTLLPPRGRSHEEILRELSRFSEDDPDYREGRTWSLVYYLDEEYTEFLGKAYQKFFSANGLNPGAFRSLKRMEKDIITITAELFNGNEENCGVVTSGGTESCLLAVKTYRDWGREEKKIRKPEMVVPETAHVAWEKGAEYFGVIIRRAHLGEDLRVDPRAVDRLVNRNTVMILGSAPEYPHGMIDPIEELGRLARDKRIPLHVDACVGGYLLPFMEKNGVSLPLWDFRVPGVTSISADTHKYGFAAKGVSTIIYRNMDHFRHQTFVYENWPGGIFASPALLGTRPGGAYAAAWAALQAQGEEGYRNLAREALEAADRLMEGIGKIDGLEVLGNPPATIVAYRSVDPGVNIFAVGDQMETRGWHIDRLQRPDALHAMVIPGHLKVVDRYLSDLAASVARVREHPELAETGEAATYGMIAHLPLRKMVRRQVRDMFAATYQISGGEIDLSGGQALKGAGTAKEAGMGSESPGLPPLVQRVVNWYIRRAQKKG
jgi:glutamate/tyrosine decarboxylase-like PLP-dependent enzyme